VTERLNALRLSELAAGEGQGTSDGRLTRERTTSLTDSAGQEEATTGGEYTASIIRQRYSPTSRLIATTNSEIIIGFLRKHSDSSSGNILWNSSLYTSKAVKKQTLTLLSIFFSSR